MKRTLALVAIPIMIAPVSVVRYSTTKSGDMLDDFSDCFNHVIRYGIVW